jgi:hypothetical protein
MIKLFQIIKNKLLKHTQLSIFAKASKDKKPLEPYIYPWHYDQKN